MRIPNSASGKPSCGRIVGPVVLAAVVVSQLSLGANANAGVFTYYDDAFTPPGSPESLRVGPASWPDLLIPNNQCNGRNWQRTGYGQSPVVVPRSAAEKCDADLSRYDFEAGDCTFADLNFRIVSNGVIVGPKFGRECSLGRMKIPGRENWYDALQFHIHATSEHSVDGNYYPAELHAVHRESNGQSFAVFGMFIDKHPNGNGAATKSTNGSKDVSNTGNSNLFEEIQGEALEEEVLEAVEESQDRVHEVFESYLRGWEAIATQTEEFCAAKPEGSGIFTPNRLFTSRQQQIQCPAVGSTLSTDDVSNLEWSDETTVNPQTLVAVTSHVPKLKVPDFPEGPVLSIYDSLPSEKNFGIYTYRGGLTTPPCTEIVHWNLLDVPMYISSSQLKRLTSLILCFAERSTCRHATVASVFGGTNRPPQPLHGRTVLHRCHDGPNIELDDPLPPPVALQVPPPVAVQPWMAVLYPWFVMALGFVVYYLLSRFAHFIPYTAVMFVLGTFMGIGIVLLENINQLSLSTWMWKSINAELLLLVFLPGLLFRDAFCLNVYLLKDALVQCLIMAFPMVLAGTVLVALVGFYILPYNWSFSLSMTFGAILSATDPVAVSALLNEVGAPPRLKMHIAGESLLNDGSAIVFYTLFASMFLFELGIPGLGREINAAAGVALFFRMSLGAVAIGLAFGLALVRVLHHFNRRFQVEEAIVQVMSTITVAYLTYYVAEPVCRTSGVIAVVTCGVVTKAFGENLINDKVMMEKFWLLVEHMLNTLIFALGGAVWGTVISNSDPRRAELFSGKDWAYLFLLYVLLFGIRTFLFAIFSPLISRIGLKSSWREAAFISFGGLRGAVGIAMSIALDNELRAETVPGDPRRSLTSQLFGLTGGISFLTLIINGTLCGPFLRKLGLADSTKMREKIVKEYRHGIMQDALDRLLAHLSDPRFERADFAIIRRHVPALRDVGSEELTLAVKRQKANTPKFEYKKPNLESFRDFIGDISMNDIVSLARVSSSSKLQSLVNRAAVTKISAQQLQPDEEEEEVDETEMMELRKLFIELLRAAYKEQIDNGEVDVRMGFVVFTLLTSLEYASDAVADWKPLCDWEKMQHIRNPWERQAEEILDMRSSEITNRLRDSALKNLHSSEIGNRLHGDDMTNLHSSEIGEQLEEGEGTKDEKAVGDIQRAITFIAAHQTAQKTFKDKFCGNRLLTAAERQLLDESRKQVSKAEEMLKSTDSAKLDNTISHLLCTILLNGAALYIGNLVTNGLLKEMEGEEYLHEYVEHELYAVRKCVKKKKCRVAHGEVEGEDDDEGGDEEGGFSDEF